jgi:hypothetical protein
MANKKCFELGINYRPDFPHPITAQTENDDFQQKVYLKSWSHFRW